MRQLVDSTGHIETNYAYDPFGVPLVGGDVYNPYQYTGEAWDAEVELLYLRARYYQPGTGRFITKDPWTGDVWRPGTLNFYTYAMGNPVGLVDPAGLQGEGVQDVLREADRLFRRRLTGPMFGWKTVLLNKPFILHQSKLQRVEPALVASIIYWESDAVERIPLNTLGLLPLWFRFPAQTCMLNLDLWKAFLTGKATIGTGQTSVGTALYLEDEAGRISPVTPEAPVLGRERLLALRLTIDAESVRYVAANVADLQQIVDEEGARLGLSVSDKRTLILAGYNLGQLGLRHALELASEGDRSELDTLLSYRYAVAEVGPIYDRLRGMFR